MSVNRQVLTNPQSRLERKLYTFSILTLFIYSLLTVCLLTAAIRVSLVDVFKYFRSIDV